MSKTGAAGNDCLVTQRATVVNHLKELHDGARVEVARDGEVSILPSSVADLAAVLKDNRDATIVAGSTDVGLWITKFMRNISPAVFIAHLEELKQIETTADGVTFGAGVTYTEFEDGWWPPSSRTWLSSGRASAAGRSATWAPSAATSPTARPSATRRRP